MLKAREELPPWSGPWPLAAMLEASGEVRYLGRLAVVLPEVEGERVLLREVFLRVLEAAGGPLALKDLEARALARRGFGALSSGLILQRVPFVETEAGRWGLCPRDIPGGTEAVDYAATQLVSMLEARGCGLALAEGLERLRCHRAVFDGWSEALLRTVGRQDPRFQTAPQGAVGLVEWESVRLPARREVLRRSLEEGSGKALVIQVQARIAALHGTSPSRGVIAWMAWREGAHLDGDWLVAATPQELPEPETLPGVPALAAVSFEEFREEAPWPPEELAREVERYVRRLHAEAVTNEAIDLSLVASLQKRCRTLLALAPDATLEAKRLIHAAVRYLVSEDDGLSDFAADGLTDDAAVLEAVVHALDAGAQRSEGIP